MIMALLIPVTLLGCDAGAEQEVPAREVPVLSSAKASRVEVVVLEASAARVDLELPGEVGGQRDANLAAANGGFVERVLIEEGKAVEEGERLAYIDVGLYNAQLDQANAQLAQARADLARMESLGDMAVASQVQSAQTAVSIASASARQAQNRLSRAVIKAPFAGVVAQVGIEQGEAVPPGGPVMRLVQLDPAVVDLSVSDRDVVSLQLGTPVTVSTASRSEVHEGTVSKISPAADLRTRAFHVEILVPNPEHRLLPGMIAQVRLQGPEMEDAVVIPQDWIVTRRDQRGVFVVDQENGAVWRDITLGDVIHDKVVVVDGVVPGDRVVVTGHRDLVDADPLIITREGRCCRDGRPTFTSGD